MTPEQLANIQARVDAATEGPWETDPQWQDPATGLVSYGVFAQDDTGLAGYDDPLDKDDATFIAAARTDVPALLALVREQQDRIGRVEAAHEPKSWTKYGIPCFDEFDSPTARINGCTCGNEHYPCPTIAALTATEGA